MKPTHTSPNILKDYKPFLDFIDHYTPTGFNKIRTEQKLMVDLEVYMEKNNQFFFVGDMLHLKILFTSKRSTQMIGIEPDTVSPYHFFESTHADDIQRHSLGRVKLFKLAQDFFIAEKGSAVISTNLKIRNAKGEYTNLLFQCYIYYTSIPYKTVFMLQLHTDIDWYKKIKHGFHYYIGNDLSYFTYPNENLLEMGLLFSDREFEIIKLIELGLNSEQIAGKLYLSKHTVNTHRRSILKKSGKTTTSALIFELKEQGLI